MPVKRWKATGALEDFGDWRDYPFPPENGYGAISVEDPVFDLIAKAGALGNGSKA
ncbi:MAG: hypothetical protein ACREC0_10565 [Methylocella sp.]